MSDLSICVNRFGDYVIANLLFFSQITAGLEKDFLESDSLLKGDNLNSDLSPTIEIASVGIKNRDQNVYSGSMKVDNVQDAKSLMPFR